MFLGDLKKGVGDGFLLFIWARANVLVSSDAGTLTLNVFIC